MFPKVQNSFVINQGKQDPCQLGCKRYPTLQAHAFGVVEDRVRLPSDAQQAQLRAKKSRILDTDSGILDGTKTLGPSYTEPTSWRLHGCHLIFGQLLIERRFGDSQQFGSLALVSSRNLERLDNSNLFCKRDTFLE